MTRILLDPAALAATAAGMSDAAGEYEAIGSRVASCDCGCMPPDVATTVDAATSAIRSRLAALATELSAGGGDLAWRSEIGQDGGGMATAASSAYGPGVDANVITIGGATASPDFGVAGGMSLVIGSAPVTVPAGGGSTMVIGGSDPLAEFFADGSSSTTLSIGGGDPLGDFFGRNGGGSSLVIGGTPPYSSSFDGPTMGDALMAMGYSIQARQQAMRDRLASMPAVYTSANDPIITNMITSQLWRNVWDSQRRLDVVMSPNYHSPGYFASDSDYLNQFPVDIRYP